jgi:hypothetical protein
MELTPPLPPPPPSQSPLPPPPPPPALTLTPEHVLQYQAAEVAAGKIRRAVRVARFDGWTIAIFAALTSLCGLTDPATIAIAAAMGAIAFVELRAAGRLLAFDERATKTLALNQLALGTLLAAYAVWRLITVNRGGAVSALVGQIDPQIVQMLGSDLDDLVRQLSLLVYGTLIGVAVFGQGGMALYYATRGKLVRRYVAETPLWIVQIQRAQGK